MRCWEISAFESWFRSFCPTRVFSSHFPGTRYVRDRWGQLSILNFYTVRNPQICCSQLHQIYSSLLHLFSSWLWIGKPCQEDQVWATTSKHTFFTLSTKPSFFNIIIVTIIVVSNVHLGIYNCRSIILPVSSLLYSNPRHHHHQHHRLTNIILVIIIILIQYHHCHHQHLPCHYRILIIWRSLARESVRTFILWRTSPASLSIGSRSTFARYLVLHIARIGWAQHALCTSIKITFSRLCRPQ